MTLPPHIRVTCSRIGDRSWCFRAVNLKTKLTLCDNGTNGPEGLRMARIRAIDTLMREPQHA